MAEAIAMDLVNGFVTESAKSLLGWVIIRIGEEIALAWGFKGNLRDLLKKFKRLEALLFGADSSSTNPLLDEWLRKVKTVAYEAEDILDEYAYELLKRRMSLPNPQHRQQSGSRHLWFKTKLHFFSRSSNPVVFRFRMAHKVKSLKDSIADVYAHARDLGIKPVEVVVAQHTYAPTNTTSTSSNALPMEEQNLQCRREHVEYKGMIGRDHDKQKITNLICHANDNRSLTVVGIYGMAGLGKTALCRSIFRAKIVRECFSKQIWICVSHDFDFKRLLNEMVEQLCGETASSIEAIKENLRKTLKGKKYLLVLDDVWETFKEVWEPLRCSLEEVGGSKGSTILVTSRKWEVLATLETSSKDSSRAMDNPCIYRLGILTKTDSWELFKQRVGNALLDFEKISIGKEMLDKCGGVPLAIRTLGSLLQSRNRIEDWREIGKDVIWNKDDKILPSVKLSFKYLPCASLKKCFAYCGIFREDEIIEMDRLIQLWMAHGLLQPYDKMDDVGEKYVEILLNSSLLQDPHYDEVLGKVISFKMHDVVHTLARDIFGPELCMNGVASDQVRHLCLDNGPLFAMEYGSNLRTLFTTFDITRSQHFMVNTKYLRALSLARVGLTELPDSIGELKHLRYLDISQNDISSLPNGITKLYNLQTLRNLVSTCSSVNEKFPMVPKEFCKLVNLQYLCSNSWLRIGIPNGLGMLHCLRTLPSVDLTQNWGGRLSELGTLTNLKGRLCIKGLDKATIEEARGVNLGRKKNIDKLVLGWSDRSRTEDAEDKMVLEVLQPHPNLASIKIRCYIAKTLPQWLMEMTGHGGSLLSNLVHVSISRCRTLEQLPSFKNLVALKILNIFGCSSIISPPDLSCLTSLEKLVIQRCERMENLQAINRPLVHLELLIVQQCGGMTALPAGVYNLPSVREVAVGPFRREVDIFPFPRDITNDTKPFLRSLQILRLDGKGMGKLITLPDQIRYLVALKDLTVKNFRSLKALPEWLGNLESLQSLVLYSLPCLRSLPSGAAMGNLIKMGGLHISFCPLLEPGWDKESRSDWCHIPPIPRSRSA